MPTWVVTCVGTHYRLSHSVSSLISLLLLPLRGQCLRHTQEAGVGHQPTEYLVALWLNEVWGKIRCRLCMPPFHRTFYAGLTSIHTCSHAAGDSCHR